MNFGYAEQNTRLHHRCNYPCIFVLCIVIVFLQKQHAICELKAVFRVNLGPRNPMQSRELSLDRAPPCDVITRNTLHCA